MERGLAKCGAVLICPHNSPKTADFAIYLLISKNIRKSELLPQCTQNQGLRIFATPKRLKNQFLFRGQQPDGWCYCCNRCCCWRGYEVRTWRKRQNLVTCVISRKALYINVSEVFMAILWIFRNSSKYHLFPQKRGFVHILSTDFWAVDGKYRYESLINQHFQSFAHFERGSFSVSKSTFQNALGPHLSS